MQVTGQNPYNNYQVNNPTPSTQPAGSKPMQELLKELKPEQTPEKTPEKNLSASNDQLRQNLASYSGYQSKMTQAEIYIKGSTGNEVDLTNSTDTLVQGYLDAKKQNDAITAYSVAGQL